MFRENRMSKEVSEYMLSDWTMIKEQAIKIALATIHNSYDDIKDDEEVDCETVKKINYACHILEFCTSK